MHDASPIAPVLSSAFADDHGAHAPLICFSHLRWDFVLQRPQHLMGRFARTRRVLMWEEAIPTTHHLPYLEFHAFEGTTVQSIRPRVPDRWSREEQEAGLARLRLYTNKKYVANLRLYGALGYRVEREELYDGPGRTRDDDISVHMVKDIAGAAP